MIVFDTQNAANRTELETITIGTQTWAKRNLDIPYFRNGDPVIIADDALHFADLGTAGISACLPGYSTSSIAAPYDTLSQMQQGEIYKGDYGYLYNYWALVDTRTLAPVGYRIPSYTEYNTLINTVGGESVAGANLKEIGSAHWTANNLTNPENSGSFNLLPGGFLSWDGNIGPIAPSGKGTIGILMTNTRISNTAYESLLTYNSRRSLVPYDMTARRAASVRCLKITQENLPAVTIGGQNWTTRNLDITTYRDGTPIPEASSSAQWAAAAAAKTGAWCHYGDNFISGSTYGKLYNWYAVAGIYNVASFNNPTLRKSLAPIGYHIPTNTEWSTLTTYLDAQSPTGNVGQKMKASSTLWITDTGTDLKGFRGLPGGWRLSNGTFAGTRNYGTWWSLTEDFTTDAWYRYLNGSSNTADRLSVSKSSGMSVRLISDSTVPIPTTTTTTSTTTAGPPTTSTTTSTTTAGPPTTSTTTAAPPPTTTSTTTQAPLDKWVYSYNFTNCSNCDILGNTTIVNSQALTVGKWYPFIGLYKIYIEEFLGMTSGLANDVLDSSKQDTCAAVICQGTTTTTTAPPTGPGGGDDNGTGTTITTSSTTAGPPMTSTTTIAPPTLNTVVATSITATGANSGGSNVTGAPISTHGVIWSGTNPFPELYSVGVGKTSQTGLTTNTFTSPLSGLLAGKRYYYRAYATNSATIGYGQVESFITLSTKPTVDTIAPTVNASNITTGGNVKTTGGELTTIIRRGVLWGTDEYYTNPTTTNDSILQTGRYTINIPNPIPGQPYYMEAYAINSDNMYGFGQQYQITFGSAKPTVQTVSATKTGTTTATMVGTIVSINGANLIEKGFVYSRASQNSEPVVNGLDVAKHTEFDTLANTFTHNASGLVPGTQYFVKAYARNSAEYAYGVKLSFTTDQATTTTSTSTTTVCARPGGLNTGRVITNVKPNSNTANKDFRFNSHTYACTAFQELKNSDPNIGGGLMGYSIVQYSQLLLNQPLYLNEGTACTLVVDGNYWFQPNMADEFDYFRSVDQINIITVSSGRITLITQCNYVPPTTSTTSTTSTTTVAPLTTTTSTTTIKPTTVTIGTQVWSNTNFDGTRYRDGTPLVDASNYTGQQWADLTRGGWCYPDNNPANNELFGKIYNWFAVMGIDGSGTPRILAPEGFHVPSAYEWWTVLPNPLGGTALTGTAIKSTDTSIATGWNLPNIATNSTGFTAMPAGTRTGYSSTRGLFDGFKSSAQFWSTDTWPAPNTYVVRAFVLYAGSAELLQQSSRNNWGCSVRLLKD